MWMATFERILKECERFYPPLQTKIEKTELKTLLRLSANGKTVNVNITQLLLDIPQIKHSEQTEQRLSQLIEENLGLTRIPMEQAFPKKGANERNDIVKLIRPCAEYLVSYRETCEESYGHVHNQ